MLDKATRSEGEPHDRLTRICDAMSATMDAHPEVHENDKAMIFIDDGKRGGIVLHGYESDVDALADLLTHLEAIFKANGMEMHLMSIPDVHQG